MNRSRRLVEASAEWAKANRPTRIKRPTPSAEPASTLWDEMQPHLDRVPMRGVYTERTPTGIRFHADANEHARRLAAFNAAGGYTKWCDALDVFRDDARAAAIAGFRARFERAYDGAKVAA